MIREQRRSAGWLPDARPLPSPNWDPRPAGVDVDLLVIHAISLPPGQFGGDEVARLFCNCLDHRAHPYFAGLQGLQVSAHLFIRRDGALWQFVPLHRRAWHAGQSCFAGRERCNDFSIGIELEGTDDGPFEPGQYATLVRVTGQLMRAYPGIGPKRIVGHSDIAPGRKTDPGPGFDWDRYRAALADAGQGDSR